MSGVKSSILICNATHLTDVVVAIGKNVLAVAVPHAVNKVAAKLVASPRRRRTKAKHAVAGLLVVAPFAFVA